jgi:hypothetical protein
MSKRISILAAMAAISFGGMAVAEEMTPTVLSDVELDAVVAGQDLYVYENSEGGYAITPKQQPNWETTTNKPGKMRGNGNWLIESEVTCDSLAGTCDGGGTISLIDDQWVYEPFVP